jgi:hypothetical protein
MNIDLYELTYRNYKKSENSMPNTDSVPYTNINISAETTKFVLNTLNDLQHFKPNIKDIETIVKGEIKFSDVISNVLPVFDKETHNLLYKYEYILGNEKNDSPYEYIERFKKFDITSLPLFEVARYLKIKVEKSNLLEPYGRFIHSENKIILGSDYAPTFIHELAHAIDYILENSFEEYYLEHITAFNEIVAELSAVVLCRIHNITLNLAQSWAYLDGYIHFEMNENNMKNVIKRVTLICEYVKKCVEK